MKDQRQRFSLRKYGVGVASVLIGLAFLGGYSVTAHADTTDTTNTPVVTNTQNQNGGGTDSSANQAVSDPSNSSQDTDEKTNTVKTADNTANEQKLAPEGTLATNRDVGYSSITGTYHKTSGDSPDDPAAKTVPNTITIHADSTYSSNSNYAPSTITYRLSADGKTYVLDPIDSTTNSGLMPSGMKPLESFPASEFSFTWYGDSSTWTNGTPIKTNVSNFTNGTASTVHQGYGEPKFDIAYNWSDQIIKLFGYNPAVYVKGEKAGWMFADFYGATTGQTKQYDQNQDISKLPQSDFSQLINVTDLENGWGGTNVNSASDFTDGQKSFYMTWAPDGQPDTSTAGEKSGTVRINFSDGTYLDVPAKINVLQDVTKDPKYQQTATATYQVVEKFPDTYKGEGTLTAAEYAAEIGDSAHADKYAGYVYKIIANQTVTAYKTAMKNLATGEITYSTSYNAKYLTFNTTTDKNVDGGDLWSKKYSPDDVTLITGAPVDQPAGYTISADPNSYVSKEIDANKGPMLNISYDDTNHTFTYDFMVNTNDANAKNEVKFDQLPGSYNFYINYAANPQKGTITYKDENGNTIKTSTYQGDTDTTVDVTEYINGGVPAGWKIVSGQNLPTSAKVTSAGIDPITVKVEHATITVQPTDPKTTADILPDNPNKNYPSGVGENDLNKTVTRTINVKLPDGSVKTTTQTAKLSRTATVDEVTGEVTYGPWQVASSEWTALDVPEIAGYQVTSDQVPAGDPLTSDATIEISYTKLSSGETTTTGNHGTTLPNGESDAVLSQENVSTSANNTKSAAKQLPQTGNETHDQAGVLGLAAASMAGLLAFGLKRKKED